MKINVPIGISNRHIHITEETYYELFKEPLEPVKMLNQPGEFSSNQNLAIKSKDRIIENVKIVGPFREYNQVEISKSDAFLLKMNPPVRKSGDLENSATITLCGPLGEKTIENACILSERHIHVSKLDQEKYQLKDNQMVKVHVSGDKSGIMDAYIKVTEEAYFEMHIDRDDANAFLLNNEDMVIVEL